MTDSIANTIPLHRQHINKLLTEGHLLSYSVSQSRNMIWCVIDAEDEQEAMNMVLSFPLYQFFTEVICHPLLFHNSMPTTMPGLSLN